MRKSRLAAGLISVATMTAGLTFTTQAAVSNAYETCTSTTTTPIKILSFTDFHGRIAASGPDTAAFFATIESMRDANTLVVSNGDNIGASLFSSFSQRDLPTLQILNAAGVDVSNVGNHELDGGYPDFSGRVTDASDFPYVSANLTKLSDGSSAADAPYEIFDVNGTKVAVVGATTDSLPELVGTEVFQSVKLSDPVAAVNKYADQLKDGNAANGEADVVIAAYHEGSQAEQLDAASKNVDAFINGHTHQSVAQLDASGRPVVQPANYGGEIGETTLNIGQNAAGKTVVCSGTAAVTKPLTPAAADRDALIAQYPRAVEVQKIVTEALAQAKIVGEQELATATAPITRGLKADGSPDNRATESTMSDLVAQMFYEKIGNSAPNFIGVQNPGGTRADFDMGTITYGEAAAILPFANTLMTTDLTGAQVKTMLEQQWQPEGSSRPYLALGLSSNVTYTYDESRAAGDRILEVWVDGKPLDPNATYTLGSGDFLIKGGDNFTVIGQGTNRTDTGMADLSAWSEWIKATGTVSPNFARQGVSFQGATELTTGTATTWTFGATAGAGLVKDSLNIASTGALVNDSIEASIDGVVIGKGTVTDGVATFDVNVPASVKAGTYTVTVKATGAGASAADVTTSLITVTVKAGAAAPSTDPSTKPSESKPSSNTSTSKPSTSTSATKTADKNDKDSKDNKGTDKDKKPSALPKTGVAR